MKINAQKVGIIAVLGFMIGCTAQDQTPLLTPRQQESIHMEEAYPGQAGRWMKGYWLNSEIQYQSLNGEAVFDGDIVIHPNDLSDEHLPQTESTGRTRASAKWPNKIVYYKIDASVPNAKLVQQAIAHWQSVTPMKFVERTTERAYVLIRGGSGCSANVGRVGVEQYITIGPECDFGNIVHELGHAVGLWHEQNRADRDQHVAIRYENIIPGMENNFQTYVQQNYDGFDLGSTMDFGSIMMYSTYAFSKNGQPTVTKKDGTLFSVQRNGLSAQDIATVKQMYP